MTPTDIHAVAVSWMASEQALVDLASWFGTAVTIVASLLISFRHARLSKFSFPLFLLGNLAWIYVGAVTPNAALVTLQLVLMAINVVGIVRWFRVPAVPPA